MTGPPPKTDPRKPLSRGHRGLTAIGSHVRVKLLAGVLTLIPLVFTYLILRLMFGWLDGLVQPLVEQIWGREIVGVGIGITVVSVYIIGVITTNFLGRRALGSLEAVLVRVPIVKSVYNLARGVVDALSTVSREVSRVVLVQWPREGTYTLGFLTNTLTDGDGRKFHSVLIPTTPTPHTGLLSIVPESEVVMTSMTVEEGIKLVVSSGVLVPEALMNSVSAEREQPSTERRASTEAAAAAGAAEAATKIQ